MLDKCIRDQWSIDDLDWSLAAARRCRATRKRPSSSTSPTWPASSCSPARCSRSSARRPRDPMLREDLRDVRRRREAPLRGRRAARRALRRPPLPRLRRERVADRGSARTSWRVVEHALARDRERVHHGRRADPRRRAAALARRLRRRRDEPPRDAPDQPRRVAPHRDRLPHDRALRVRRAPRGDAPRPWPTPRELARGMRALATMMWHAKPFLQEVFLAPMDRTDPSGRRVAGGVQARSS